MMRAYKGLVVLTLFLMACTEPVVRDKDGSTQPLKQQPQQNAMSAFIPPDLKKRLWVLEFNDPKEYPAELNSKDVTQLKLGQRFTTKLVEGLNKDNSPYVVDLSEMSEVRDIKKDVNNKNELSEFIKLAASSNVAGLLVGTVQNIKIEELGASEGIFRTRHLSMTMNVDFTLYDTQSGRQIYTGSELGNIQEIRSDVAGILEGAKMTELHLKVDQLSLQMAEKMLTKLHPVSEKLGWSGRVVGIEGNRVYLNAGKRTGLKLGDILKVIDPSQQVLDPSSGGVIGHAPGRMKGTVKLIQLFGIDGAITVIQSGGGFIIGDRVELF